MSTLHPWQSRAVSDALAFLRGAGRGDTKPYTSPTGSGKSYMQAAVHEALRPDHHLVVPTLEIAVGVYEKLTGDSTIRDLSEDRQRAATEDRLIFTALRYYNLLLAATVGTTIPFARYTSWDEGHHSTAATYKGLYDLMGRPPRTLWTATPYRGTPAETAEFFSQCTHPLYTVLTLRQAVEQGVIARPDFEVWPLLNDDLIDVVNGEFVVRQVDAAVKDKMAELVSRVGQFYDHATGLWDRPTMMAFTSVAQVGYAELACQAAGLPAVGVTGGTRRRQDAFRAVVDRRSLLLQVSVVGEGVDLPLRRLVDCAPTLSPVKWMQRLGRVTRPTGPGERPPEYVACCHNLTRHAYLWHGLIPAAQVRRSQVVWGEEFKPSRRHLARAIGLEGFGRFAVSHVPLADGLTGQFYGLQRKGGDHQYALFLHPLASPLFFHRHNDWEAGDDHLLTVRNGVQIRGRKRRYGTWTRIPALPDLEGCVSLPPTEMSPYQLHKWKTEAATWGLDPDAVPDRRLFALLPILQDARLKIKPM